MKNSHDNFHSSALVYRRLLPEEGEVVASMGRPTFCGQFSDDGQCFISACQGKSIELIAEISIAYLYKLRQLYSPL